MMFSSFLHAAVAGVSIAGVCLCARLFVGPNSDHRLVLMI